MTREETMKMVKAEIINSAVDEIEIGILQKKEDILMLGKEFITVYISAKRNAFMQISNEDREEMARIQSKYLQSVEDIKDAMKAHRYIEEYQRDLDNLMDGWLKSENESLSEVYMEIEESFIRKKLDKENKDK